MNADSRDDLINQAINNAVTDLIPHGAGTVTETRLRHILKRVAAQSAQVTRSYELLNIRDTDDLMDSWGVSRRRVQAHCKNLHDRWGVGRKIGNIWLLSADEADSHAPGPAGRPKTRIDA